MKKHGILLFLLTIIIITSCKKKQDDAPSCVAGAGGAVAIVTYALRGSTVIENYYTHLDTAFVRFGTLSFPGTNHSLYNTYFVSEPGEDHIHCEGLKCGDYFIYRTAWDSVANVTRHGGMGISISESSGEKDLFVPVH